MDVTLLVMASDNVNPLAEGGDAALYKRGDIVDVFPRTQLIAANQPACFVLVHVTGLPDRDITQFKARLPVEDRAVDAARTFLRKRKWGIPTADWNAGELVSLAANREVEVTALRLFQICAQRRTGTRLSLADIS